MHEHRRVNFERLEDLGTIMDLIMAMDYFNL